MLKTLTTISLGICITATAHAQQGAWLLETSGSYEHHNIASDGGTVDKPVSLNDWNILVNAGYQFHKNWTVGIAAGYGQKDYIDWYSTSTQYSYNYYGYKIGTTLWSAGVFGRYTYAINKWLFIYGQLNVMKYGTDTKTKETFSDPVVAVPIDYAGTPQAGNGIAANMYPAVGFNVINGYGVDMSVGGLDFNHYNGFTLTDNTFKLTLGKEIHLGIHKFIGWKKANGMAKDPLSGN